ncbi:hypothetical protein F2Q68_00030260 [Brassica cretica]|uniref:Uncharacterized protein n=1 Tax=Brassica cretica TaxID=69181 RepID=A0A8S9G3Y9_BRACR|nr:hypothetical protein F2Q68_00030260 [Brassica cretica]
MQICVTVGEADVERYEKNRKEEDGCAWKKGNGFMVIKAYVFHCRVEKNFQNLLNSQQPNTQWNESVSASVPREPYQSVPREPYQSVSASDASTAQSSSSVQVSHGEEAMARPVGVKAAKAKGKKPVRKQATLEEEEKERMEF